MAGRREVGSGSTVEGFHTGDTTSYGKHVMFKGKYIRRLYLHVCMYMYVSLYKQLIYSSIADRKRKNECNRKGSRLLVTPSPPMEKVRQSFGYHSNASTRRHSSEQRLYSNKGISSDGLECIEKDVNVSSSLLCINVYIVHVCSFFALELLHVLYILHILCTCTRVCLELNCKMQIEKKFVSAIRLHVHIHVHCTECIL